MATKRKPVPITSKTGIQVTTCYCRKCMRTLPAGDFYDSVDAGLVDTNGKFSVCKVCVQLIYDEVFAKTNSIEKTIHKLCMSLNVKFSNEALNATKAHINTLLAKGNNVTAIFSIYKMKLVAVNKSMDKSIATDDSYEDVGTIFTTEVINLKEVPIPVDVVNFWGRDLPRDSIEFLETQYANFKQTHKADTYAEIVLLKEVCYTLLDIKAKRLNMDDTDKSVKQLQDLMTKLAISPNAVNSITAASGKGAETLGLWIRDVEEMEPCQWLKTDPRGDMYRDVADVEGYFQKYIVRPLKNFILQSKDFNIDENDEEDLFRDDSEFSVLDEGYDNEQE